MKYKIEPNNILTIDYSSGFYISYVIKNNLNEIIHLSSTTIDLHNYITRKNLIDHVKTLIEEYNIDMIIMEENKLFTDTISKFPDPYVLKNILLGYGIQTSIEDNFFEVIKYIMYLPEYEWKTIILNKKAKFMMDVYKEHTFLTSSIDPSMYNDIETYNHYKAICLSQSSEYSKLMNAQYWVNKKMKKE